jgi:hypothetical protein
MAVDSPCTEKPDPTAKRAILKVVTFPEEFMSLATALISMKYSKVKEEKKGTY